MERADKEKDEQNNSATSVGKLTASKQYPRPAGRIVDLLDREEQHSKDMENLREENNANMSNLVSMTRVMSSRRRIDALANTASAEAVIDAMSNFTATTEDVSEE